MLNEKNVRELAYVTHVDAIEPMNADRLECACVGGWRCVVGKGEFKVGDPAVYFEIDAKLPDVFPFSEMEFLRSKDFKIKSQRIRGVVSQGLLVPFSAFYKDGGFPSWLAAYSLAVANGAEPEHYWLTEALGVTYAIAEDNARKSNGIDKYKKMAARHPDLAKTAWWRWLWHRAWGKRLLFMFFGRKRDKKNGWPAWVVKTDEERVQCLPYDALLAVDQWIATEKCDGTSTTFTMRGRGRKRQFLVCSRNVVFDKPDKKCFYDTNVYTEMAEKYHMEEALENAMNNDKSLEFITIQGETYGGSIQKRNYGDEHRLAIFNVIFGYKDGSTRRLNPVEADAYIRTIQPHSAEVALTMVPIVDFDYRLPDTCDELLEQATGKSRIDGGMREGLVFRSLDGVKSFKAVSNEFLLKYHS